MVTLAGCNAAMDRYSRSGGLLHDHFSTANYGDVVRRGNIYCSSISMGAPRISKISNGCLLGCSSEYDMYNFTCETNIYSQPSSYSAPPILQPQLQPPVTTIVKPLSLDGFKSQCKQLGFKVGTPDFGNCVLQLNEAK